MNESGFRRTVGPFSGSQHRDPETLVSGHRIGSGSAEANLRLGGHALLDATMLIAGSMIGSGVFSASSTTMREAAPTHPRPLASWRS
jgi:hypothetical protein